MTEFQAKCYACVVKTPYSNSSNIAYELNTSKTAVTRALRKLEQIGSVHGVRLSPSVSYNGDERWDAGHV